MIKVITGQTQEHLIFDEELNRFFHKDIYQDFLKLKELANDNDIDLYVISSFRDFNTQLNIWNKKATGQRDLLDDQGDALEFSELSPREIVFAILRWSAFPGASRHHWGTDFDIVDKRTWPKNYEVQLIPEEFNEGGHFYKLRNWFDKQIENNSDFQFFRPYQKDQGGVAPEMWHLSHRKTSSKLYQEYDLDLFLQHLNELNPKEVHLLDEVQKNAEEIYFKYIANICD